MPLDVKFDDIDNKMQHGEELINPLCAAYQHHHILPFAKPLM